MSYLYRTRIFISVMTETDIRNYCTISTLSCAHTYFRSILSFHLSLGIFIFSFLLTVHAFDMFGSYEYCLRSVLRRPRLPAMTPTVQCILRDPLLFQSSEKFASIYPTFLTHG